VPGDLRRLHNENLSSLYLLSYDTRLVASGRMKCMLHVACVLEMTFAYEILVGNAPREDVKWKVSLGMVELF
jgi:hypothetical protein